MQFVPTNLKIKKCIIKPSLGSDNPNASLSLIFYCSIVEIKQLNINLRLKHQEAIKFMSENLPISKRSEICIKVAITKDIE